MTKYVSTSTLILLIILSFIGCRYNKAYNDGYKNGLKDGRTRGYQEGIKDGYDKGYSNAYTVLEDESRLDVITIDNLLLKNRGNILMSLVFSWIIIAALCLAIIYLILYIPSPKLRFAKFLALIVSSFLWFRIIQALLLNGNIPGSGSEKGTQLIFEIIAFIISSILCFLFDHFYIKTPKEEEVWIDIIGIAFCTFLLMQLSHYLINWKLLLKQSSPQYILHLVGAFIIGGILYTIFALVKKQSRMDSKKGTLPKIID